MKKTLLTVLGVSLVLATNAQTAKIKPTSMSKDAAKPRFVREESANPIFKKASVVNAPLTGKSRAFGRPQFANYASAAINNSANAFGLLTSYQTVLTANQDLNAIMFTNRQSTTPKPPGSNSGWVYNTWSTNNGSSWNIYYVADEAANTKRSRYPGGVFMNMNGNSDINQAMSMSSGPWFNGSTSLWEGSFYSVAKLDKSGKDFFQPSLDGSDASQVIRGFARNNHVSVNENAWVGSYLGYIDGDDASWTGIALDHFKRAADKTYTWMVHEIPVDVKRDGANLPESGYIPYTAFSPDGSVGYAMTTGVLAGETGGNNTYLPIVYKTLDGGVTWNPFLQQPWEHDFAQMTILGDTNEFTSVGGNPNLVKPFFGASQGMDVTVDANGQFHIFCEIGSGSSTSEDSLGYSWTYTGFRRLYDVYTRNDGTQPGQFWCVMPVDTIWTDPAQGADVANSPWSDGSGGQLDLDARLQISRSEDGTKIFYAWADSDPGLSSGFNTVPEIYLRGFDVTNKKWTDTYQASDDAGQAFFFYASEVALKNGSNYQIPLSYSLNDARDGISPVDHTLITSAIFNDADFVNNTPTSPNPVPYLKDGYCTDYTAIKHVEKAVKSVGLTPNPVSSVASINVSLEKAQTITVEVVNALGAVVYSSTVNGVDGNNVISVSAANLNSGVYFYNVKAGESVSTGKMVVQK